MDVHAARANQLPVCIVRTGYESAEALEASHPDFIIDDLTTFEVVLRHFS
ncbi:MAG UNVERIFIED_CONTAM: HAD hydrolase-like protein [Anaerolineae bacterium]|jgi:phosphoglycolate phosphatase-like HAD superfamily hydrolase